MTREPCLLCGDMADVRLQIVRWIEPPSDVAPFASLARCRDHRACQRRVEAHGDLWPVAELSETTPDARAIGAER